MKRKRLIVLPALLLIVALLLQGCTFSFFYPREPSGSFLSTAPASSVKPSTDPAEPTEPASYVPYTEYERPMQGTLPECRFSEMEYTRPDTEAIRSGFAEVQKLVEDDASLEEVLTRLDEVYTDYLYFTTMDSLAYIHYSLDLNDSFYDEEYNWCEAQSPLVSQAQEKCYVAMAQSPLRDDLEREYFTEGFFDFYDENQIYTKDRVVELMQQESELETQYMALQSDRTIEWEGEEVLVDDLFASDLDYFSLMDAYRLYYEKYNPLASDLFIRLIRVRREIAAELEYDSFADFAYEYYYRRDYTPAQVSQYTADIARELSPLYYTAAMNTYSREMDTDETMELFRKTVYTFGGEIATAYEYMTAYELYDITESSSKLPGSYMTYLNSYEMPFLYVSPTDTIDDLLTVSHEFGHFVDGYVNCGATDSIDCNEIFSQGLEFLTLGRAELSESERALLTSSKLADSVSVFLSQASYAEFEQRAYELPDEKLTAEGLNELFVECSEEFGMSFSGMEDLIGMGWIDIQHFFIAPFYVISYCVSNDAALQIYQRELASGDGLALYRRLMELSGGNTILNLLDEADMESPFAEGRMAELADFLQEHLN